MEQLKVGTDAFEKVTYMIPLKATEYKDIKYKDRFASLKIEVKPLLDNYFWEYKGVTDEIIRENNVIRTTKRINVELLMFIKTSADDSCIMNVTTLAEKIKTVFDLPYVAYTLGGEKHYA